MPVPDLINFYPGTVEKTARKKFHVKRKVITRPQGAVRPVGNAAVLVKRQVIQRLGQALPRWVVFRIGQPAGDLDYGAVIKLA